VAHQEVKKEKRKKASEQEDKWVLQILTVDGTVAGNFWHQIDVSHRLRQQLQRTGSQRNY
jgi:hypothetical protein